ncbi:MAG: NADH-quinone oxidoreductase subunit M [Fimbriimonas sp.]|nr:NADH-quinone oxidoreductase subunit M [Fimbriimonas sp.]
MYLLTILTFLPLLGAIALVVMSEKHVKSIKQVALLTSALTFLLSLGLLVKFDSNTYAFQLEDKQNWIPQLGIGYHMGLDGISLWLVLLTTLLSFIAVAYSMKVDVRVRAFLACLLTLEAAMIGSFLSLDLILFFVFFELTLIPMWLLINIWGGERRAHAANKFLIYTFAGSIFMLVGIVFLGYLQFKATGKMSFDIVLIQEQVAQGKLWANALQAEPFIFWAFAIALLVKTPAFPFHTWIPDTYSESPIAAPILSSVMVKMGTYGFLRFCLPLFPDALPNQTPILITLAVVGILYGAIVAAVQPDMRRVMAYSSLSHMGFVLLGIFSLTRIGMMGGAFQQLNHGITATILFLLIGFLYQRGGSTLFKDYSGLKSQMPIFAALFLIAMLSSVGLPGTNGFVGEFLALVGAFQSAYAGQFAIGIVVVAVFGVVLAAVYMLYMFQRVFYGEVVRAENRSLQDLRAPEIGLACILVAFILWGGLAPNTFMTPMQTSLDATLKMATAPATMRPYWSSESVEAKKLPAPQHKRVAMISKAGS